MSDAYDDGGVYGDGFAPWVEGTGGVSSDTQPTNSFAGASTVPGEAAYGGRGGTKVEDTGSVYDVSGSSSGSYEQVLITPTRTGSYQNTYPSGRESKDNNSAVFYRANSDGIKIPYVMNHGKEERITDKALAAIGQIDYLDREDFDKVKDISSDRMKRKGLKDTAEDYDPTVDYAKKRLELQSDIDHAGLREEYTLTLEKLRTKSYAMDKASSYKSEKEKEISSKGGPTSKEDLALIIAERLRSAGQSK